MPFETAHLGAMMYFILAQFPVLLLTNHLAHCPKTLSSYDDYSSWMMNQGVGERDREHGIRDCES